MLAMSRKRCPGVPCWLLLAGLAALALALPRWLLGLRMTNRIHTVQQAPTRPLAIVFGAGLRRDGRPTTVLADRVRTAVSLYRQGKVQALLMSGSVRAPTYDEPAAMRAMALQLGVPDQAILLDRGGSRTYQTCARARDLLGARRALLVTQRYHLPRALITCQGLGIQAQGVAADLSAYSRRARGLWALREIPATLVAMWEVFVNPARPLATTRPIPPGDTQHES